jgi:hypothetical protein
MKGRSGRSILPSPPISIYPHDIFTHLDLSLDLLGSWSPHDLMLTWVLVVELALSYDGRLTLLTICWSEKLILLLFYFALQVELRTHVFRKEENMSFTFRLGCRSVTEIVIDAPQHFSPSVLEKGVVGSSAARVEVRVHARCKAWFHNEVRDLFFSALRACG